ncbi:MAG: radical SAM protein, partial [Firmicutes bacterium]|nr:radical SAM protein [Bacillota bacterium]
ASNKKILHYLDMPIQHSTDKILKRMGRKSDRASLVKAISDLRAAMPDICLRTTLIVGFPGETQQDFDELCGFISEIKFDRLGVFTYSREEGTPAYNLPDQIDEGIKQQRKDYILDLQKNISAKICEGFIGKELEVIVEGKLDDEDDVYCSRSYRDCYEIDGFVFFNSSEELIAGDFYRVKVTSAGDYDLIGELI